MLLLDEPSLGLAPILVQQIFGIISEINGQGTTILLVEQNALQALTVADRGYVLQTGQVVLSGKASEFSPTTWCARPTSARSDRPTTMPAPRDDGRDVDGGADRFDIPLVRVGGGRRRRGPSVEQLVALVVVAVAITVIKPWGSDTGRPSAADRPAAVTGSAASAATAEIPAGPSPTPDPGRALAAEMCLEPSGWRMFATERWSDRLIRSWVLVEPLVGASGPDDPRIPFIDESSMAVLNLGYCAPISGPDRPSSAGDRHDPRQVVGGFGAHGQRRGAATHALGRHPAGAGPADARRVAVRRIVGPARPGRGELAERDLRVRDRRAGPGHDGEPPLVRGHRRPAGAGRPLTGCGGAAHRPSSPTGPGSPRRSGSRSRAIRSCRRRPCQARPRSRPGPCPG